MNKLITMLCCLFCISIYGQEHNEPIKKQKVQEVLKTQIKELEHYLQELESMGDTITQQDIDKYPQYIKSKLVDSPKTILEQLQELRDRVNQREKAIVGQWYPSKSQAAPTKPKPYKAIIMNIKLDAQSYNTGPDYFEVTDNKEGIIIRKSGIYEVTATTLVKLSPSGKSNFIIRLNKKSVSAKKSSYAHHEEWGDKVWTHKYVSWAGYLHENDVINFEVSHNLPTDIAYNNGPANTRLRIQYIGR